MSHNKTSLLKDIESLHPDLLKSFGFPAHRVILKMLDPSGVPSFEVLFNNTGSNSISITGTLGTYTLTFDKPVIKVGSTYVTSSLLNYNVLDPILFQAVADSAYTILISVTRISDFVAVGDAMGDGTLFTIDIYD